MGWLAGYKYRKEIAVGPANGAGTNYQVKITARYGAPRYSSDPTGAIFASSFEEGYAKWDGGAKVAESGCVGTIAMDAYTRGRKSFKVSGIDSVSDQCYLVKTLAGSADIFAACDVMLPAIPAFGAGEYINAFGADTFSEVGTTYYPNAQKWGITWFDGEGHWHYETETRTSPLTAGEWYTTQIYVKRGDADGIIKLWVNNVEKMNMTGLDTGNCANDSVFCGMWADDGIATPYAIYYDNYVVSATKIPYVVEDTIDYVYLAGKCKTDFADVKFTAHDGTTQIDYWLQEKVDSLHGIFWVEVPDDISAAGTIIYMYYGNASATSESNGAATFPTFDHFDNETLAWNTSLDGGTVVEGGTDLRTTGGGVGGVTAAYTTETYGLYHRFIARARGVTAKGLTGGMGFCTTTFSGWELIGYNYGGNLDYLLWGDSGRNLSTIPSNDEAYHVVELRRPSATRTQIMVDDVSGHVGASGITDARPAFIYEYSGSETFTDWVAVTKYVYPEPVLAAGPQRSQLAKVLVELGMI